MWHTFVKVFYTYNEGHVVPLDDLRPHSLCEHCWCKPLLDISGTDDPIYIHNSMDGREDYETGKRKPH